MHSYAHTARATAPPPPPLPARLALLTRCDQRGAHCAHKARRSLSMCGARAALGRACSRSSGRPDSSHERIGWSDACAVSGPSDQAVGYGRRLRSSDKAVGYGRRIRPSVTAVGYGPSDKDVGYGPSDKAVGYGPSDQARRIRPSVTAVGYGRRIRPSGTAVG